MKFWNTLRVSSAALIAGLAASPAARADVVTLTFSGHLNYAYSFLRSGYVNNSSEFCMQCGEFETVTSASDGSAVGLNAQVGDAFTMTYTFDTSVAPSYTYNNSYNYGTYQFDNAQSSWDQVPGHGSLTSTINGQTWSGNERYGSVYGEQYVYDQNVYPGEGYAYDQFYADLYHQATNYTYSDTDYYGNTYGPYTYSNNYGSSVTQPGNLTNVVGNPNGYDYNTQTYFNFYNYIYGAGVLSQLLSGIPTTIDLSDYQYAQTYWSAYGLSGYQCGYATGYGQSTYCQWDHYAQYNFQGQIESVTSSVTSSNTDVPAPGALALLGLGLFGIGAARRTMKTA